MPWHLLPFVGHVSHAAIITRLAAPVHFSALADENGMFRSRCNSPNFSAVASLEIPAIDSLRGAEQDFAWAGRPWACFPLFESSLAFLSIFSVERWAENTQGFFVLQPELRKTVVSHPEDGPVFHANNRML